MVPVGLQHQFHLEYLVLLVHLWDLEVLMGQVVLMIPVFLVLLSDQALHVNLLGQKDQCHLMDQMVQLLL